MMKSPLGLRKDTIAASRYAHIYVQMYHAHMYVQICRYICSEGRVLLKATLLAQA